jgi:hypothetical protein
VPLPAALWPSLATLGLLILVARVRSKMGHA